MPAYNFKREFAGLVERGDKRQTIRKKRKRPTVAGDRLYLYTGMRTKGCRLLGEAVCREVLPVDLDEAGVWVGGRLLDAMGTLKLARADGFATVREFRMFFEELYGYPVPVGELELIRW